ncbi:MAG: tetratricopeptide repeat protein [Sulfurimonas sp.]|jgi:TPR repeat protein|nr:tetratricopeptide repeat protein [Sulfurimonas sp.]
MKNSVKKLIIASLFVGVGLYSLTLTHPDFKQVMICEGEAKNPNECLKAVEMLLKSKKNVTDFSTYRFDFYTIDAERAKRALPERYKQTDEEFIDEMIAQSYLFAGIIYFNLGQPEIGVEMYQKALEYDPKHSDANANLGVAYLLGKGIEKNKIQAYKHWMIAAKQGNSQSQNNLDVLCRESPWACK